MPWPIVSFEWMSVVPAVTSKAPVLQAPSPYTPCETATLPGYSCSRKADSAVAYLEYPQPPQYSMRIPSCDMVEKALRIVVGKKRDDLLAGCVLRGFSPSFELGRREVRPDVLE